MNILSLKEFAEMLFEAKKPYDPNEMLPSGITRGERDAEWAKRKAQQGDIKNAMNINPDVAMKTAAEQKEKRQAISANAEQKKADRTNIPGNILLKRQHAEKTRAARSAAVRRTRELEKQRKSGNTDGQ